MKQDTGIPLWIVLLGFGLLAAPLLAVGIHARADTAAMCAENGYAWQIYTTVSERVDAEYGRVTFSRDLADGTRQPYIVKVRTDKPIGTPIMVLVRWDCHGKHIATEELRQQAVTP